MGGVAIAVLVLVPGGWVFQFWFRIVPWPAAFAGGMGG